MKSYTLEFRIKPYTYKNVLCETIEADSPAEALAISEQMLLDRGMTEEQAFELTRFNKIREVGDNCTIYTLWR